MSEAQGQETERSADAGGEARAPLTDPASRRRFLRLMGAGGAAGAATLLAACGGAPQTEKTRSVLRKEVETSLFGPGDVGIIKYALTLEYLEEDFYKAVNTSGEIRDRRLKSILEEVGENESEHVDVLRSLVRQFAAQGVPRPKTNFDKVLAGGKDRILNTAATIENLGAAAYLGQAGNVKNESVLEAALRIHSVEARHAAALNELAGRPFRTGSPLKGSVPNGAFARPMSARDVLRETEQFIVT